MNRNFKEPSLLPISKDDINDYFKVLGADVIEIIEDFEFEISRTSSPGDLLILFSKYKQKIQDYFNSVKIK